MVDKQASITMNRERALEMGDQLDVITALKQVDRALPEAGKVIRNYIDLLKSRAPQPPRDENAEQETK